MLTMSTLNRECPEISIEQKAKALAKSLPTLIPLTEYIRDEKEAVDMYNFSLKCFQTAVRNWDINDTSEGSYFMESFIVTCNELEKAQANLIKARRDLGLQLKYLSNYGI